jgi:CHAT domain-containing protein
MNLIPVAMGTPVTSLWSASDECTVRLTEQFYRNLKTMDKAEVLRQAQLDLMRAGVEATDQRGLSGIVKIQEKAEILQTSHPSTVKLLSAPPRPTCGERFRSPRKISLKWEELNFCSIASMVTVLLA